LSAARSARLGVPTAIAEGVEHLLECEELQDSLDHEDGVPGLGSRIRRPVNRQGIANAS
jgi:hypothetical protein